MRFFQIRINLVINKRIILGISARIFIVLIWLLISTNIMIIISIISSAFNKGLSMLLIFILWIFNRFGLKKLFHSSCLIITIVIIIVAGRQNCLDQFVIIVNCNVVCAEVFKIIIIAGFYDSSIPINFFLSSPFNSRIEKGV